MAFSALVPRHSTARVSRTHSDLQEKESYFLLQDSEHHSNHQSSSFHQDALLLSNDSSMQKEVPTFIVHQGFNQGFNTLQHKKQGKPGPSPAHCFDYEERGSIEADANAQNTRRSVLKQVPGFHSHVQRFNSMRQPLQVKPSVEQDHVKRHKMSYKKLGHSSNNQCRRLLKQAIPANDGAEEQWHRHSSASARDMVSEEVVMFSKQRFCHDKSWEEEVRQALARNSISKKHNEDARKCGHDKVRRSNSVRECGSSEDVTLPSTLIMKRKSAGTNGGSDACLEEVAVGDSGRCFHRSPEEKRIWSGFNVKSPSEERWEEAAEDEERQERQRRVRSQSLRYDNARVAKLDMGANGNSDEWAVYRKSDYMNIQPHMGRGAAASATPCCPSALGRSLSMRDTRMGLVMECAACGAALHGAGGRLLCFCSCCAMVRTMEAPQATKKKGGGGGILRACRRLISWAKKRPATPEA